MKKIKKEELKSFAKKHIVFLFVLTLFIIVNSYYISTLKQIPSPLYGGDYYYHLGGMINIQEGNSYLDNPQMNNEYSWTPPLYNWLVVGFADITYLEMWKAVLYFSIIVMVISLSLAYFIGLRWFEDSILAIIFALFFIQLTPILKYSPFGHAIIAPLLFYIFFRLYQTPTRKNAIYAGLCFGLMGITHLNIFIAICFFVVIFFIWMIIEKIKHAKNKNEIKKELLNIGLIAVIILVVSLPLIMITWYVPLVKFHLKSVNNLAKYDYTDLTKVSAQVKDVFTYIKQFLTPFDGVFTFFKVFSLAGLFILLFKKKKNEKERYMIIMLAALLISLLHIFITVPLLDLNLFNDRLYLTFAFMLIPLLSIYALSSLWKIFFNKFDRYKSYVFFVFLVIMIIISVIFIKQQFDSKWFMVGKQPLDPINTEVSAWIKQNTKINDVLLTTNENSFAIGALTGRKGLNLRRSHSGMYVDVDKRYMAAALILYGNDEAKRIEMLKAYNVTYLYWDYNWINLEFYFDEQGMVRDWFDPLLILYTPERENTLRDANISFTIQNTWVDPAVRPGPPQYKTLLVTPNNYRSYESPWNEKLDKYLVLEKEFMYQSKAVARIYRIKTGN